MTTFSSAESPQEKEPGKTRTTAIIFVFSLLVLGVDLGQQGSSQSGSFRRFQSVVPGAGIIWRSLPHMSASSWDSAGISLHLCGCLQQGDFRVARLLKWQLRTLMIHSRERADNYFLRVGNVYQLFMVLFNIFYYKI